MKDFPPHPSCPRELDEASTAEQGSSTHAWETPITGRGCPGPVLQTSHEKVSPKSRRYLLRTSEHPHRAEGCGEVL